MKKEEESNLLLLEANEDEIKLKLKDFINNMTVELSGLLDCLIERIEEMIDTKVDERFEKIWKVKKNE